MTITRGHLLHFETRIFQLCLLQMTVEEACTSRTDDFFSNNRGRQVTTDPEGFFMMHLNWTTKSHCNNSVKLCNTLACGPHKVLGFKVAWFRLKWQNMGRNKASQCEWFTHECQKGPYNIHLMYYCFVFAGDSTCLESQIICHFWLFQWYTVL